MAVSSRVSPYPLRSCRNKKQKDVVESELESMREWEDVRCVICMEPPHNAILLQCASFSKGCRAYMCDTSARHSNCYKQFRRNNSTSRCSDDKTLHCPYCRGEVFGTTKSTCARRFLNARPRCCSVEKCDFSGSYSQLKTHLKVDHPGYTMPKLLPLEQRMWNQLEREAEYIEMLNAHRRWEAEQRLATRSIRQLPFRVPVIDLTLDAFVQNLFFDLNRESTESRARSQASSAHMGGMEFHSPMYPRWTP